MTSKTISLCFPDEEKSCFACCPPIRPAGYEHLPYKNIMRRIFRENSNNINNMDRTLKPITGFSCWALGYINKEPKLIGCLLYPALHHGVDLRYRIDFGDKCRRETCQEEKIFTLLGEAEKGFWLRLSDGLDSFAYSSRDRNSLFRMLGWGTEILRLIAKKERGRIFTKELFFRSYPFFNTELSQKGNTYFVHQFAIRGVIDPFTRESFREKFEIFSASILRRLIRSNYGRTGESYTHLLDIDPLFSDFLRLSAGISKTSLKNALDMKDIVDEELEKFIKYV